MPDIDSSKWTGPEDGRDDLNRFSAPTHRAGQPAITGVYQRLAAEQFAADRRVQKATFALRSVWISAGLLLVLTPLFLFLAWAVVVTIGRDFIVKDNSPYLWGWAVAMILLSLSQLMWRTNVLRWIRAALLIAALAATVAVSVGYVYLAVTSKAHAVASAPERVFELYENRGDKRSPRTFVLHQRADGTVLGGGYRKPIPYGYSCALAQSLTGDYGFTWVRVIDRSPARGRSDLFWPIRREDCFSDTPLSELPR